MTGRDRDTENAAGGGVPDALLSRALDAGCAAGAELDPIIAAVRSVAIELLASLPERPQRLRLRAAGVDVDLDWRLPQASAPAPVAHAAAAPAAVHAAQPAAAGAQDADAGAAEAALHYICAHTVGTFYRSPEPGAPPFVAEGVMVRAGQQVGIVEAMKLMLPVEADRAGRVVAVLAEDGQAVEYQERLIALGAAE